MPFELVYHVSRCEPDGVVTVRLRGELDIASIPAADEAFANALSLEPKRVDVDLWGVSFCDSSGLSLLLKTQKQLAARSVALCVVNPSPQVQRLLAVTDTDQRLNGGHVGASTPEPV